MTSVMKLAVAAVFCAALGGSFLMAEEKKAEAAKHEKEAHVYAPYSKLTLTDDQKKQISAIQKESRAKIKAIEDAEEAQVATLLNDDQKKELAAMEAKAKEHQQELAKEHYAKLKEEKAKEKAAAKPEAEKK